MKKVPSDRSNMIIVDLAYDSASSEPSNNDFSVFCTTHQFERRRYHSSPPKYPGASDPQLKLNGTHIFPYGREPYIEDQIGSGLMAVEKSNGCNPILSG